MGIKDTLLEFMREEAYRPMDIQELVTVFDINPDEYKAFKRALKVMELEGSIVRTKKDKFAVPERLGLIKGKLQAHKKGFGFLIPEEEGERDVFIPSSFINGAMNNDRVLVQITRDDINGKKREGEVIEILERANTKIIGVYEDNRNFGFVVPEDTRLNQDIFISKKDKNGATHGDVVIVEVTRWPDKRRSPEGIVKEVLGKKGEKGLDILTIIKKHGLPEEFPPKVLAYAEGISEEIEEKEIKRRKDIRNLRMVTIDGEDAKDLDDAVSIEKLDNGKYKLGVHIADVTHYVREKNPLDKEALKRGTSVYLIDRVIPMLPKKLSNGICSLNPKVDRLALSCFMTIDSKGKVCEHEIAETVIRTSERMTYTDVTKILRDHDEELIKKYDYLVDDFKTMEELCLILREKRMKRGAIDFDFEESKIILNENGKPIDIKPYEREIANRIIEEFMLAANETVAKAMTWLNVPFIYRVHEEPSDEKITKLLETLDLFGYNVKIKNKKAMPKKLQEVLLSLENDEEKDSEELSKDIIINQMMIRSMSKAKYQEYNIGHFGLASECYTHFTSPIRRYPDLLVHRLVKQFMLGEDEVTVTSPVEYFASKVNYASIQSSKTEKRAEVLERDCVDYKKVEYASRFIGTITSGLLTSITNFGVFITLDNSIEGLVKYADMQDDYYDVDDKFGRIVGERYHKVYQIGDRLTVKIVSANLEKSEINFKIIKKED